MLKLQGITKDYIVGDGKVEALKGVDIEFRKSEFVAILGASGCGKTTLLNIVGGLDKYTTGDLIINNKSTKNYSDYEWDTYRNHSVGFVFQSYNLIPHQTVLNNVELALTLSGVSKHERRQRAKEALKKVGLGDQINKKPNQLSGGQMQRVSIARAIVNDPEIILADEPTGALDTTTSIQVLDILKEIAKDRLVVMVTHNPELADQYATRTIRLTDGLVISDSNPYESVIEEVKEEKIVKGKKREARKHKKKSSMSFWTAFSLSLNNLMTKKARTILTAFAGSIGIIGIALILSLSSGFQNYIDKVQEDTLSTYPIVIESQTVDYTEMMESIMNKGDKEEHGLDKIYSNNILADLLKTMSAGIKTNDLKAFKKYLDSSEEIQNYTTAIKYTYNSKINIYSPNYSETTNNKLVPADFNLGTIIGPYASPMMQEMMNQLNVWEEMLDNQTLLDSQYELIGAGSKWPSAYNEVVVVVNENNELTDHILFSLGLKTTEDFYDMMYQLQTNPNYVAPVTSYTYEEILGLKYKLVVDSQYYEDKDNDGIFENVSENPSSMKKVLDNSLEVEVVGIVRAKEGAAATSISGSIGYTKELTEYIVKRNKNSDVVIAQQSNLTTDVTTGELFDVDLAGNPNVGQYQEVLTKIGYADLDVPATISLYPTTFEAKDAINKLIKEYNEEKLSSQQIQYTDYIGIMMSSVSTIIDAISYVLIAFVSISLIVSSIMIGIITYISVLERTKEIGVLRSIGARKKDISRVFNAETLLIGFVSGALGIGVTVLLDIPINIILKMLAGIEGIAKLPVVGALILVAISMLLTFIAGLIPSRIAAKKDPVIALRTE